MANTAEQIGRVAVAEDRFMANWGVKVYDYSHRGVHVDLQDMLVSIAQRRALAIEDEVIPLQKIISKRNERLQKYGTVLSKLTELQTQYAGEDTSGKSVSLSGVINSSFTADDFNAIMKTVGYDGVVTGSTLSMSKAAVEGAVARIKSNIDEMNNAAQKDMTRLQAVVDRRDESFSTATTLMTSVSDTRSSTIKNL
ncbi:MAG: hypothetical protein MJ109_05815 [Kiritimatiellae bacterium]|nr:hypothetical protein [Kiritimatiellia bacterium]